MSKAIIIEKPGGVENFKVKNVTLGDPEQGEVLIRHTAIGVNFIDIYHRLGIYPLPEYPAILGVEAAGVVEKIGQGVANIKPGDRVAYCTAPVGTYCEKKIVPADVLVCLPVIVSDLQAAAVMVKGLTAWYLLNRTYKVKKNTWILVHAAAGGVGQILCSWGKFLGAKVIGTVGSEEKAVIAENLGCDYVINYRQENFAERVMEITGGRGVDVVYDSIGKDTFAGSLECAKELGMIVSYGQASGAIPPVDIAVLQSKSLFLTRPSLLTYIGKPDELQIAANELFRQIKTGVVKAEVSKEYRLQDAAKAHQDLESRKTVGASVLVVS